MSTSKKRILAVLCASAAAVALVIASYLQTFGHCFLPMPGPATYANEKIEVREYHPFFVPAISDTFSDNMKEFGWRLEYPGRARLIAMAKKLEADQSQKNHAAAEVYSALGYPFSPGCFVGVGDFTPHIRIANYPSILNRIENDLKLKPIYTNALSMTAPAPRD